MLHEYDNKQVYLKSASYKEDRDHHHTSVLIFYLFVYRIFLLHKQKEASHKFLH